MKSVVATPVGVSALAGPAPPYTQPVPDDLLEKHRLTVEHATAHALVSAASLDEAAPRVLEAICESLGWEHGAYWTIDPSADLLRCANIWTLAGLTFPEFDSASCAATFPRGDGFAGTSLGVRSPRLDS